MTNEELFINTIYPQAVLSGHIWPKMATAECCLESGWGKSKLFIKAKNIFGQKWIDSSQYNFIIIPTKEFIHGQWVTVSNTKWVIFPTLQDSFKERMLLLEKLRYKYSDYDLALLSGDSMTYIRRVSHTWSTDPERADKVISIYNKYQSVLDDVKVDPTAPSEVSDPDTFWEYLKGKLNI